MGTFKVTSIIIGYSFLRTNWREDSCTSSATLFLRALTFTVFFTVSSAGTETTVLIVSTISSANWLKKIRTFIASHKILSLVFAFSEVLEISFITFEFTQVSISNSIFSTSRHESFGTKLTSFKDRRTLSVSLFNNSNTILHALIIIGQTINSANRSVKLGTVTSGHARSFGGCDLLRTRENT